MSAVIVPCAVIEEDTSTRADAVRCAGWGDGPPCTRVALAPAMTPSRVRARKGEPWRCRAHAMRMGQQAMTPETRARITEALHKGRDAMTPEQRALQQERAREGLARTTPWQKGVAIRKGLAALTPEQRAQRQEAAIKASREWHATRTPEQRREARRKGQATILAIAAMAAQNTRNRKDQSP